MDILSWLDGTQFWHWWILAAIFAGIEILAPGVFFIWLGAAAAVTGVIAFVIPSLGWEIEALLFAVLAVLSIVGWRSYQKKTAKNEVPSHPQPPRRTDDRPHRRPQRADPERPRQGQDRRFRLARRRQRPARRHADQGDRRRRRGPEGRSGVR